jgi:hypothetical protein
MNQMTWIKEQEKGELKEETLGEFLENKRNLLSFWGFDKIGLVCIREGDHNETIFLIWADRYRNTLLCST